jgi:diguanylate cyclase (GGDEF)-like protein
MMRLASPAVAQDARLGEGLMSATPRENGHHADTGAAGLGAPRIFGAAVAVALVLFTTGAVVLTASGTGLREKLLVSNCLFLVSGSAAAVCCLYTASRTRGALRRAWSLFAAMGAAWTIGNVVWFVQSLEPVKAFPTLSDLFFVVALVLAAAGLLRFPAGRRVKDDRVRLLLDGLLIGCSVLFLSNVLVLEEMFARLGPGLSALLLAVYPLGDVLLASLALLFLTRSPRRRRADLVLLACGLLVYAFEDTAYALLQARAEFHTGTPFDLGWIGGYLLIALAALTFSARAPATGVLRPATDSRLGDVLVNLVVGLAVVIGVWVGIRHWLDVALGVILLVLYGVRQGVLSGDNRALRRGLARLAETDPLTGLANRRRLERDLDRLLMLAVRYRTTLSLSVVDLDHFKGINDRHGHVVGDETLRRVAAHLQESFRGEDAIARIGGEEFVVAMLGMGREDAVARLAGVLQALADTTQEVDGARVSVGASAGVAEQGRDGTGFEELYRAADDALRVAKVSGRGRVLPAGAAPPVAPGPDLAQDAVVEDGPAERSPA